MRNLIIGVLFLLTTILFLSISNVNAGNLTQIDTDVWGNKYLLDDKGQREAKLETDTQGNTYILNRYGVVIGKMATGQIPSENAALAN